MIRFLAGFEWLEQWQSRVVAARKIARRNRVVGMGWGSGHKLTIVGLQFLLIIS